MNDDRPEPGALSAAESCWRCGKTADPGAAVCAFCRARLGPALITGPVALSDDGVHPLFKVIIAYSVMLVGSLIWGWVVFFHDRMSESEHLSGTSILEGFDTAVVLITAMWIGRLRVPKPGVGIRIAAWLAGPFAVAFVLMVNVAYRWALLEFLRPGWLKNAITEPEWSVVTVLLMAVQPALVEEWFFRHLALGALRTATGTHAAVWVSAIMFAVAHVYNPLGLPWLLVAGVMFGYARMASGGLALPVLMHFAHNALILWFQGFV